MSRSFYLPRRVIKHTVLIIESVNFVNYIQGSIRYPAVTVNSTRRGYYWGSSGWISSL